MITERNEFKPDGTHVFTHGGKAYEVTSSAQNWLREQMEQLTFGDLIKSHRLCEGRSDSARVEAEASAAKRKPASKAKKSPKKPK